MNEDNNNNLNDNSSDLLSSDGLGNSDLSLQSEESSQSREAVQFDYSDYLTSIDSSLSDISSNIEVLSDQVDNMNSNLCTLTDAVNIGVALLFSICVFLVVKVAFAIFNRVLGLGSV